jgi:transposase
VVFEACRSRRGDKGRDDRRFLEALHYFTLHNVTWRALPKEFGPWNSVWKRFWRLRQGGVFEAFFETLAGLSRTAHLVQMFDSTVVRAHVSVAGAKGGKDRRRSAVRVAASRPRSTLKATLTVRLSPFI